MSTGPQQQQQRQPKKQTQLQAASVTQSAGKDLSQVASKNTFVLIDAANDQGAECSTTKLASVNDYLSKELNNNSILSYNSDQSSGVADRGSRNVELKSSLMDPSKRKWVQSDLDRPSMPGSANKVSEEPATDKKQCAASAPTPRRALSPQRQQVRGQLRKQSAAEASEIPDRLNNKFQHGESRSADEDDEDGDDDNMEEDDDEAADERVPFNANVKKLKAVQRVAPVAAHHLKGPSYKQANLVSHNKQHKPYSKHPAHTKISFNDSRPPSFNTCQAGGAFDAFGHHHHHQKSIDFQEKGACCLECDCSHCNKTKNDLAHYRTHSRTRSLHLVLKSIILVLLNILLLMIFIGILAAVHYLPHVFDRVLNASRTFNVTIAG